MNDLEFKGTKSNLRPENPFGNKHAKASAGAGMFAGACGIFVGFPFDTMKVKLQSSARSKIVEKIPLNIHGIRLLYKGVIVPMSTAGVMQSMNFALYDASKRYVSKNYPSISPLTSVFIGGAISGLVMSVISTPTQLLKVQLQTHAQLTLTQLLYRDIYSTGKYKILYRGFGITAFSDCVGRGLYMYSYELAKASLPDLTGLEIDPLPLKMTAAAYAGVISWLVMFPADTIKTLVQSSYHGPSATQYLLQFTTSFAGVKLLYRGCLYAVIRAAPVAATILPLYEHTQEVLMTYL